MVRMVRQAVGDREVEQVDSSDENLVIVEENEEEAYQKIADEFGVEPVKIMGGLKYKKFDRMEYDPVLQVAEFYYKIGNETLTYLINASYKDTSWGLDIEEEIKEKYTLNVRGCRILIKEYEANIGEGSRNQRLSAQFSYGGVEYFMTGTMLKEDFQKVIDNLHFY